MTDEVNQQFPCSYNNIIEATNLSGFTMASDVLTCSLLRTLSASKPSGKFLELGTGTGLSTAWILDGMDTASSLISIDNDAAFVEIAKRILGNDNRLNLVVRMAANGSKKIKLKNLIIFLLIHGMENTWY